MVFFFTIPVWVVLAVLFFAVGFFGMSLAWVSDHILIISLVIWGAALLITALLSKGRGFAGLLQNLSGLLLFVAPYMLAAYTFLLCGKNFYDGSLIRMLMNAAGGFFCVCIAGLASLGLFSWEAERTEDGHGTLWFVPLNLLASAALCLVSFILFIR